MYSTEYTLSLPNREVRIALNDYILSQTTNNPNPMSIKKPIFLALQNKDLKSLKNTLISMFAKIPYNNYANNNIKIYEGYYASVVYSYFASLGLDINVEVPTNNGRIDMTIETNSIIYIIEFKVGKGKALKQIKDKNYALSYKNKRKEIVLVGINFDENEKNISEFEWELI